MLEVNTNTAVKAYDLLARDGVIYNKRGLGYFVSPGARDEIMASRKKNFIEQTLPDVFHQMRLLGIDIDEVSKEWEKTNNNTSNKNV